MRIDQIYSHVQQLHTLIHQGQTHHDGRSIMDILNCLDLILTTKLKRLDAVQK